MRYRMMAIDLDGTLLNERGDVCDQNLKAIQRAIDASMHVVICTGRAWCECRHILDRLPVTPLSQTGVFVTGATVSGVTDGVALNMSTIKPALTMRLIEHLWDLPEAVLIFQDARLAGRDYLVTGAGRLTANTRWWFSQFTVTVHHKPRVGLEDLEHTLRVAVVGPAKRLFEVMQSVSGTFGSQVMVHHFAAVAKPTTAEPVHVMEIFAGGVDKCHGLSWVAGQHQIVPDQIVAIGDQINDVALLRHAGCSIAMANGAREVMDVADHITRSCDDDGVAHAIDQVLAGVWG